jgi:hypothetical protein
MGFLSLLLLYFVFVFAVLRTEPRASQTLGKGSTTETLYAVFQSTISLSNETTMPHRL